MAGWNGRFKGDVEGRYVELEEYDPGGELRVKTTQKKTDTTAGSYQLGSTVFPSVINEGDEIHIDGVDADELEERLIEAGFTENGAKQITRLVRLPSN